MEYTQYSCPEELDALDGTGASGEKISLINHEIALFHFLVT